MQKLLSDADRALGRLDGSIETLPNPDLFVYMYVRKEAVLSSQIEGTQSSLQDVLTAEAKILAADRPDDVDEVVNYVAAMNYGLERLERLPVSVRLIREIHEKLLQGTRGQHLTPGEVRTSQNWIGPPGSGPADAVFVPPPPEEVGEHLSELERFLHNPPELPILVQIGLAHVQFETIHPFLDGNGRVGRLLIAFLLCEKDILQKPVLYLSHYFKKHRTEYYEQLQSVRDKGTWEQWLTFFLTGVVEVSRQATQTSRAINQLRESDRNTITEQFGRTAANGHRVLEHLYRHPIISISETKAIVDQGYQAASDLVERFVESGILTEITGNARHRKYQYHRYIELFGEDGPEIELT